MFDLLKESLKFHIEKCVKRGRGSWGFLFPAAIFVLFVVLWALRTTVVTMEYDTASLAATQTDGAAAEGLDGSTVMLGAGADATSESDDGIMLLSADEDESTTESDSEEDEEESSTDSGTDDDGANSSTSSESVTYSAADVTYDETTGNFDVSLTVSFEFLDPYSSSAYYVSTNDYSAVTDTDYTQVYRIQLPEDIIVPTALMSGVYNGTMATNSSVTIFKYYYDTGTDENGDTIYYIYLVFASKDKLEEWDYNTDDTLEGYVVFSGSFSSDAYEAEDDAIKIYDSDETTLLIEVAGSSINYPGNSTTTEDISVLKTGKYDSSTGLVTYTIKVYSKLGTGDTIELTDYFSDSGFSGILGELGSITVTSTTVSYTTYNGVDYNVVASTASATSADTTTLTKGGSSSTAPYYYVDDDGTIHMVLKGLKAYSDDSSGDGSGSSSSGSVTANAYVITYTYKVDPDYQTTYSATNSVTAETKYGTDGYIGTISDTDTATVYVSGSTVLSKTGSYDSSAGEVTWTITVGDGTSSLAGYVLSDDMISGLTVSDITITAADSTSGTGSGLNVCYAVAATDSEGNVTYTYYSDAALTNEIDTDSGDSGDSGSEDNGGSSGTDSDALSDYDIIYVLDASTSDADGNYAVAGIMFNSGTQYTITYTTSVDSAWTSQTVTNTAVLTYEGDDAEKEGDSYTSYYSMYITGAGAGAFSKSFTRAEESESTDSDGNTVTVLTLTWSSTFKVPATGIPAGTVFTDSATSYSGSGIHYMTYDQASAIVTALKAAWGDNTIEIEFRTASNGSYSSGSTWVSSGALDSSEDTVYDQFRFTLLYDIVYDDSSTDDSGKVTKSTDTDNTIYTAKTITYSYTTTALTAGYDSNTYYNTLSDGSVSQSASYTWYEKVVKYGTDTSGNITDTEDTSITTSVDDDGNITVSWIVRLVVDSDSTYTVTDTLPEGMTLSALYVSKYGNYNYNSISISDSSTEISGIGTFAYSTDTSASGSSGTTTVLKISDISSGVTMLYLKYTCTYTVETDTNDGNTEDDSGEEGEDLGDESYSFTNSVTVTKGDDEYGSASQTTTVTVEETSDETADLTKSSAFDSANNILTYTVDINPDATTYTDASGEAYSDLTVTDTLSYYSFPGAGMIRSATLLTSSLNLVDADTGEELDSSEYSWTYSEDVTTYDWGYTVEYISETLTLTVPNGRHLTLTYEYSFTIIQNGDWTEYTTNATNTATLSAESETIYTATPISDSSQLSEVLTYGVANSGTVGYTIYKVDEDNFSTRLSGAEFTLYMYDSASGNFIAVGTYTTGSGGSVTISGTPVYSDDGTTLVSYSVTVPDSEPVTIPADTICFLVETTAPEDYKLDDTKYYFYYGSSVSAAATDCAGYTSAAADAKNMVISYSNYITNEHSSDYYAAKTSISVLKKWFDSNGEEYEKSDGSVTFALYRVLKLTDGTITSAAALESGDTSGGSSSSGSDDGVYLSWQLRYNNWSSYVTYEEGKAKVTAEDGKIYFSFYYSGMSQWYLTPVTLSVVTASGTETLATVSASYSGTFDYTISDAYSGVVKGITYSDKTYTFELCVTESMEIICDAAEVYSYNLSSLVMSASVTTASDDSDSGGASGSGTSDGDTDSGDSSSDTEITGTVYRLNFSDLYKTSDFQDEKGNYGDISIKGYYGWTDEEKSEMTATDMTRGDSGFFQIYGTGTSESANLSASHGTASYDIDGDDTVDEDEAEMAVCLKMENGVGTTIKFTSTEGGYLTLVFNSDGSGNSVKLTNADKNTSEVLSPSESLYVIYEYLDTGTYTITYNQSCYLFYLAFTEGAEKEEEDTDAYIHNFNDGLTSSFYTIKGSLSYNYGTVSYDDIIASQCLKMNSSASITFTSTEAGTIYLILTNPKGASKIGVTLDGEEVYATATQTADTQGYRIYTIMQRVEAGTHTITRINGTEVMLYYIAYMADDYGGNNWGEDEKNSALENLTEEEQETYARYAELVDTITISASTDWAWYSSSLASEYVDTETGVVKGEYLYYLVETEINGEKVDSNTYTVAYLNDDGIEYGSIGISNTIVEDSDESTAVTVEKSWATGGSETVESSVYENAVITYSLYAIMTLNDNADSSALAAGTSIDTEFTTSDWSTITDFYTVAGSRTTNGTIITTDDSGTTSTTYPVTYETSSTEYGLKLDSKGGVTFEAPATDGTLTLVFSTYNRDSGNTVTAMYGPNFSITGPDGTKYTYTYTYDSTTKSGTLTVSGGDGKDPYGATCTSYSTTNNAAVFTLTLASAGEYKVSKGTSECYLHYIEYAYQYCNLVEGVLIQTATLSAATADAEEETTTASEEEGGETSAASEDETETTADDGTGTNSSGNEETETTSDDNTGTTSSGEGEAGTTSWSKTVSGLPTNIYDEDGNKIGTYSYYVKETGVSLYLDGGLVELTAGSDGSYSYETTTDDGVTKYYVSVNLAQTAGNGAETVSTTTTDGGTITSVTAGMLSITNTVSLTSVSEEEVEGYVLPGTGGPGSHACIALGFLLLAACAVTAIVRDRRETA